MTAKGKIEKILATLENLSNSSFTSFRRKLNNCDLPKRLERIPWNILEEADPPTVVYNIIRYYTTKHGPQIVMKVLKDINERQASLDLETELNRKNLNSRSTTPKHKHHKEQRQTEKNSEGANRDGGHLNDRAVGKSQISSRGSNLEVGLLDAPGITDHTSHATAHAEETNLNSTPEINIGPVSKETFYSVGPSTDSTNMLKDESFYIPVHNVVSTEHKNQQRENNVIQNISNKPLTGLTKKPNIKRIRQKGKPLQDLKLPALKKGKRELIEKHSKNKPQFYTKLLFQHFVQYETYVTWHQNTNFDGYGDSLPILKPQMYTLLINATDLLDFISKYYWG
ncbi:uncharacterized protein LOC121398033 isoform X2 [Xenopus laevis]|uniref:Uncharacterized protein LOC121398033 isoform X2 n=1 Tax=Xenopus laevis TaxID=8355 RepID=A0A8J1LTJ3_XENLA|nr:uncharacterized protein LOC121398033 isoform X2 [Xenopus laevis]